MIAFFFFPKWNRNRSTNWLAIKEHQCSWITCMIHLVPSLTNNIPVNTILLNWCTMEIQLLPVRIRCSSPTLQSITISLLHKRMNISFGQFAFEIYKIWISWSQIQIKNPYKSLSRFVNNNIPSSRTSNFTYRSTDIMLGSSILQSGLFGSKVHSFNLTSIP